MTPNTIEIAPISTMPNEVSDRRCGLEKGKRGVMGKDPRATLTDECEIYRQCGLWPRNGYVGGDFILPGRVDVGRLEVLGEVPVSEGLSQVVIDHMILLVTDAVLD
jgi:hypothetical protein